MQGLPEAVLSARKTARFRADDVSRKHFARKGTFSKIERFKIGAKQHFTSIGSSIFGPRTLQLLRAAFTHGHKRWD